MRLVRQRACALRLRVLRCAAHRAVASFLLCLTFVLFCVKIQEPTCARKGIHNVAAVEEPYGVAAGPVVSVVAGLMVTRQVASELINAVNSAVQDFNRHQKYVQIYLRMYVGQQGHPMLEQQLALEASLEDTRDVLTSLPVFVKGGFPENMNEGKTYEWFRFAGKAYPSSDWILKFDTDIAVNWTAASPWLRNTSSELRYMGFVNDHQSCGEFGHCPPPGCDNMSGSCWVYMSGGLYGLSTPLARIISDCMYYRSHKVGYEDLLVGKAVKHCAASNSTVQLMSVPHLAAWCHNKTVNLTHIRNSMHIAGCS